MQALPPVHPPQSTVTPHESTPMTPQCPVQLGAVWHVCESPLVAQTFPPVQGEPQAKT
jgi:hypothetical protein